MKKMLQVLFAGCMLFSGGILQAADLTELRLLVKVRNLAGFDEATITSAEQIVTGVFRRLGVEVAWPPVANVGRPDLWINLVSVTAARMGGNTYEGGLAAVPRDGRTGSSVWVFRPVLETVIDKTVFLTPQRNPTRLRNILLAHVMAHEMGHLLLGSAKHSSGGIMTRELNLSAIRLACTGSLEFSRSESGKIRATVQGIKGTAYALTGRP